MEKERKEESLNKDNTELITLAFVCVFVRLWWEMKIIWSTQPGDIFFHYVNCIFLISICVCTWFLISLNYKLLVWGGRALLSSSSPQKSTYDREKEEKRELKNFFISAFCLYYILGILQFTICSLTSLFSSLLSTAYSKPTKLFPQLYDFYTKVGRDTMDMKNHENEPFVFLNHDFHSLFWRFMSLLRIF
jgi:hypothetical protein